MQVKISLKLLSEYLLLPPRSAPAAARTLSEINAFMCFMQIFKMVTRNGCKMIFGKK